LERTLLPAASADCSASNWAKGIDADLVLDCSQPAFTDISGTAAATQITKINSTSCTNGIQTASDGTVSCLTASSTPEFVSRVMTAGGTLGNYAVVMADGSDDDEVIEATTSTTQILGCSQDSDGTTSTNPVEVAVAGIARCKADTTVTAGSLVKLGATGEFSLATTAERTWGRAVTDDDAGSASAYILLFDGAEGTIDHKIDVWPSIPDLTTNTETALSVAPTVDISSTGTLKGISVAPDTDTAAGGTVKGIVIEPTLTQAGTTAGPNFYGLEVGGTVNVTNTTHLGSAYAFVNDTAFTSPTAGSTPVLLQYGFWNKPSMTMTASSSSATSTGFISVMHNPTWVLNSTGGGASASYSVNEDVGVKMNGTYTKTAGTALTVSLRDGLQMNDPSTSGSPVVTEVNGLNVKALTVGTTISAVKSALAPASNNYFLNDTGGAQSKFTGKITTYNNVATVQGGVPSIVANVALTAQTASIAATTLYAVPASQGGMYRVCYHAFRTRAATTSSTLGPITFTATQTVDSVNRTWPQASITNISTNTTNTTAGQYANCLVLEAKASTNIQYIMGYTSSGATTMEYALYITAERLQG
jgi:hypothetical protein